MSAPTYPPAFPPAITSTAAGDVYHGYDGMTLRDWFAGQAIGEAARHAFDNMDAGVNLGKLPEEWAAQIAYRLADELLAAREQGK